MDKWFSKRFCDRCGGSLKDGYTMSFFNTDAICMKCKEEERKHPDFPKAVEEERRQLKMGNRNFEGIGWPGKDGRIK